MRTIQIDTRRLVGLNEIQAMKLISVAGGHINVLVRDGIPIAEKTDMRTDRVNLEIHGDKVVRAYVG